MYRKKDYINLLHISSEENNVYVLSLDILYQYNINISIVCIL